MSNLNVARATESASAALGAPVLEIRGLSVSFPSHGARVTPVREISLVVRARARVAIVGESGSGKSLTARAAMRLLKPPAEVSGDIIVNGRNIYALNPKELARVRGSDIAIVFQDPVSSLNPVMTVGAQVIEAIRTHRRISRSAARQKAVALLDEVGIADASRRMAAYPHELSGGMRQRVMIAMAISGDPALLIADEATSALDVTTQARVLQLLSQMVDEREMAVVLITHDLAVATTFATEIVTMYAGRIVETAPVTAFVKRPVHPYSEALLGARCRLDSDVTERLVTVPGHPPIAGRFPSGCAFHPRCPYAAEICQELAPPSVPTWEAGSTEAEWQAECHFAQSRMGDDKRMDGS